MTDKRIVLCTAGSEDEARKIAEHLVGQRLAACVNIVPRIESIYRWKEKVESSHEYLLLIKTSAERFPQVRDAIGNCILMNFRNVSPSALRMGASSTCNGWDIRW